MGRGRLLWPGKLPFICREIVYPSGGAGEFVAVEVDEFITREEVDLWEVALVEVAPGIEVFHSGIFDVEPAHTRLVDPWIADEEQDAEAVVIHPIIIDAFSRIFAEVVIGLSVFA